MPKRSDVAVKFLSAPNSISGWENGGKGWIQMGKVKANVNAALQQSYKLHKNMELRVVQRQSSQRRAALGFQRKQFPPLSGTIGKERSRLLYENDAPWMVGTFLLFHNYDKTAANSNSANVNRRKILMKTSFYCFVQGSFNVPRGN